MGYVHDTVDAVRLMAMRPGRRLMLLGEPRGSRTVTPVTRGNMSNGQQTLTRVARSRTHGNGLFARATISKGRTILRERVLVVRDPGPEFENYVFDWGRGRFGLALGSTSLINHSSEPNAEVHTWDEHVTVVALREIRKGEEIFIDYGPNHPVEG